MADCSSRSASEVLFKSFTRRSPALRPRGGGTQNFCKPKKNISLFADQSSSRPNSPFRLPVLFWAVPPSYPLHLPLDWVLWRLCYQISFSISCVSMLAPPSTAFLPFTVPPSSSLNFLSRLPPFLFVICRPRYFSLILFFFPPLTSRFIRPLSFLFRHLCPFFFYSSHLCCGPLYSSSLGFASILAPSSLASQVRPVPTRHHHLIQTSYHWAAHMFISALLKDRPFYSAMLPCGL